MLIDVYDFDGTIYDGDSTVDLVKFCIRRHPSLLSGLPGMLPKLAGVATGRLSLTAFKTALFSRMDRPCDGGGAVLARPAHAEKAGQVV